MHNLEIFALLTATWETIYIVFISSLLSVCIGAGLGIVLFLTREQQLFANRLVNQTLGFVINSTRSIPFIILLICILPLTRLIVGTTIGSNAAIVPLTLAAIPFFARICESAFVEIPHELIITAKALGVTTGQLIRKILLPEALPALIRGITLTIISLIGYSAMAGAIGGGGLGELAINYGYQRFNVLVTLETVVILIIIVQLVQLSGDLLAKQRRFKPIVFASVILSLICFTSQIYPSLYPEQNVIRVGVISGWSEEVLKVAQKVAAEQYQLKIKIVSFSDYGLPNTALANGDIDANIFQHLPYLQAEVKAHHYPIVPLAKTFVYPMGFYSTKITTITDLKPGAVVAIPNDPSNQARSLLLLQKAGFVTLKPNVSTLASVRDVLSNPKHLQFKLLDAAQLPRVLRDADLVAITNDYLGPTHLKANQALLREGQDSLYANVIVIRKEDEERQALATLVTIMHSRAVVEQTYKIFPDQSAIPAW